MPASPELLQRITTRPEVFGGKPIVRDLRISVELILSLLCQGVTPEEILEGLPGSGTGGPPRLPGLRPCRCRRQVRNPRRRRRAMKFLIDRCAGTRLVAWLRDHGHDVLEAQSLGADPGDQALLERAAASGRVMITIDSDFGELIHRQHSAHAGLIRLPDVPVHRRRDRPT